MFNNATGGYQWIGAEDIDSIPDLTIEQLSDILKKLKGDA